MTTVILDNSRSNHWTRDEQISRQLRRYLMARLREDHRRRAPEQLPELRVLVVANDEIQKDVVLTPNNANLELPPAGSDPFPRAWPKIQEYFEEGEEIDFITNGLTGPVRERNHQHLEGPRIRWVVANPETDVKRMREKHGDNVFHIEEATLEAVGLQEPTIQVRSEQQQTREAEREDQKGRSR